MKFEIGRGFEMKGIEVKVDVSQLSIEEIEAGRIEFNQVANDKGLWPSESAGRLKVTRSLEASATLQRKLLSTVVEGAGLYLKVVDGINNNRKKKDRIPLLRPEEYAEIAEDWLSHDVVAASQKLPVSKYRPRLIIPCLSRPIARAETVAAIGAASDKGVWRWAGRMAFLKQWTDDQLSGFDPDIAAGNGGFYILSTAYDKSHEGSVDEQNDNLKKLRKFPEIQVAPIFTTAILGQRYRGQYRNWEDTCTRGNDLQPDKIDEHDYIPFACIDKDGGAVVRGSEVHLGDAARLLAK